jgi:hypothetical protein
MEPLEDYLLRVGKVNEAIYEANERLMKQIKDRQIEEVRVVRELVGGNKGIHMVE